MVRAGAGFSALPDAVAAAREAGQAALRRATLDGAGAGLVFASQTQGDAIPKLLAETAASIGTRDLIGCTATGILADGRDAESEPGVAVLAIGNLAVRSFLARDLAGREADAGSSATLAATPDRFRGR